MKKLAALTLWALCLGGSALASGRDVAAEAALASAANRQQALRLNDMARMKSPRPQEDVQAGQKNVPPDSGAELDHQPGAGGPVRQPSPIRTGEPQQPRQ